MITSTRQGCARSLHALSILPTSSFIPPLPYAAESSRQASRRALLLQRQTRSLTSSSVKGKAPEMGWTGAGFMAYSGASAARKMPDDDLYEDEAVVKREMTSNEVEQGDITPLPTDQHSQPRSPPERRTKPPPSEPSVTRNTTSSHDYVDPSDPMSHLLRPPPSHRNPLLPFPSRTIPDPMTWRRHFLELVLSEPLVAFLSLATINEEGMSCVSAEDFDSLYKQLATLHKAVPTFPQTVGRGDAGLILVRLRDHLYGLPPVDKSHEGYQSGRRLRGRRLEQFLRLCVWFRCNDLARQCFVDYFPEQILKSHSRTYDIENYATFLADERRWNLLIQSYAHRNFPMDGPNLPFRLWTPVILSKVCTAYFCLGEPTSVIQLIDRYRAASGRMTSKVFQYLIQGYIETGQLQNVTRITKEAQAKGLKSDKHRLREQLAILRGQRALGFDRKLERGVLLDIESNKPTPSAEFLHSLVRLRLDNNDVEGAKKLMKWFDLGIWDEMDSTMPKKISHTDATIILAFDIITRRPNMDQLRTWWKYIRSRQVLLDSRVLGILIRALSDLGHIDEVYQMIRSHITTRYGSTGVSSEKPWTLPPGTAIDLKVFNALLAAMVSKYGILGIKRTADLMREAEEYADGTTLKIILGAVRQHMSARPTDLANLYRVMLDRAKDVNAQIGHIDTMMAQAVEYAAAGTSPDLASEAKGELSDPTSGLQPIGAFSASLDTALNSLRSRGVLAQSESMANRLRFEATHGTAPNESGISSAKTVWNEFIARGYKPTRKHLLALMQGYADAGQLDQAADVLNLARRTGNTTTRGMLMTLLVGYSEQGNLQLAEKVYDTIRNLGHIDSRDALDVPAICAMIRGYYRKGNYNRAAKLTKRDLIDGTGSMKLDDKAVVTGMTALRWTGQTSLALDLVDRRSEQSLNYIIRRSITRMRTHISRKISQNRGGPNDHTSLERIETMLQRDMELRPYLDPKSDVPFPENDRIPDTTNPDDIRTNLSTQQQQDLAILFDPKPLPPLPVKTKKARRSEEEIAEIREQRRIKKEQKRLENPELADQQERHNMFAKMRRELLMEAGRKRAEAKITEQWSKEMDVLGRLRPREEDQQSESMEEEQFEKE